MKNITIFTICTGKYTIFFNSFYQTCEKFFLTEHNKTYYVFTDGDIGNHKNVVRVEQSKLGWPYDTMMRFKMFNTVEDKINDTDYTFFFNANMVFTDKIGDEVLPSDLNSNLVGVLHPYFWKSHKSQFTYERRSESSFYMSPSDGESYFQGCFIGGSTKEFMKMSRELDEMINIDLSNNIIPIWHDESAMNWYYSKRTPLKLLPSYACPEMLDNFTIDIKDLGIKAVQIDKNKLGGYNHLRS